MTALDVARIQRMVDELRCIERSASSPVKRDDRYLVERDGNGHVLARFTGVNPDENLSAVTYLLNNAAFVRQTLEALLAAELGTRAALL